MGGLQCYSGRAGGAIFRGALRLGTVVTVPIVLRAFVGVVWCRCTAVTYRRHADRTGHTAHRVGKMDLGAV